MMQHIETIELTSSQSSITFSSIPQDYDDLVILLQGRGDRPDANSEFFISFNSSTTNLSNVILFGRGGNSVGNGSNIHFDFFLTGADSTSNTFGNASIYVSNYTSSTAKSFSIDSVSENNATKSYTAITAGLWNDTSAINAVVLNPSGGNTTAILAGSTASLYGITAGGSGTVTTA